MRPPEPTAPPVAGAFARACADLTHSQQLAVDSPAGALCVVAGAGSGKTRVLTLRVARRILDGSAGADHTVVCTFTRKAARELRGRLAAYDVPVSDPGAGGQRGPGVRAGTLHQLALTLLRRRALDTGQAPPAVLEDRWRTLAELAGDPTEASVVDGEIGWAKAQCLGPETYPAGAAARGRETAVAAARVVDLFGAYDAQLARRGQLDLDDLLLGSADLLLTDAGFAERARWRYRHLFVDEFQDVNPAQFRLIRALLGGRADLCAVGDPNQAIYGWNGADPGLIRALPDLVEGLSVVHLDENHRSSPQVVAAATAALGPTTVPPPRSSAPDGPRPVVTTYDDDRAEAEGVASFLLEREEAGIPWPAQAVLARTHDQLTLVGRTLERAGIPTRSGPAPSDGVELATFHRAKGLEWEVVCVVGLEEGFVPIVHATGSEAVAEERRLLYVALTRAVTELHCSWARSRTMPNGRVVGRRPSPWLAAVARVSLAGQGRIAKGDAGQRIAALRAGLGSPAGGRAGDPGAQRAVSMKTGAWSDGF